MTRIRVFTALAMTPFAVAGILLLPTPWLVAAAAVLFLTGLWEWFKLAEIDDSLARTVLLLVNLLLMVALAWGSRTSSGGSLVLFQLVVVAGVIWWLLACLWLKHYNFASDHDTHARMFKLAAGTLAVVPAWCALALLHATPPNGHRWLLVALAIVWAGDTGAYFVGRAFGKHKLAPRISPNKSVEGLFGGMVCALLAAAVLGWYAGATPEQQPWLLLVALATFLASVVGDLFESLLKRHIGVKDSGDILPGHGGILDRIDAVLAALPVFALGKLWLGF
ncbi:MAG TPA: phosphatidate cytidylyltransferase [Xanthomonadaceae bacterium]|jgi:phosphatidate cytidylyltransferase|nr:phosphatidate cytidylyltransferase [Xanthomonadaceae bacterium]